MKHTDSCYQAHCVAMHEELVEACKLAEGFITVLKLSEVPLPEGILQHGKRSLEKLETVLKKDRA